MITRLGAVLASVLLMLATAAGMPSASADTSTPCGQELAVLRADTMAVQITGGKVDKERAGLVKIVDDVTGLTEAGKASDAAVKLTNLQTKVDDLAAAGRIGVDSAALLSADIAAVADCIASG